MTTLTKTKLPKEIIITASDLRPFLKDCLKDFREDMSDLHTDEEWNTLAEILDEDFWFYPMDCIHDERTALFPRTDDKYVESYVRLSAVIYQALWEKIGLPDLADDHTFDDHEQRYAETSFLYHIEYMDDYEEEGWCASLIRPYESWEDFQDANKDNSVIIQSIHKYIERDRQLQDKVRMDDSSIYRLLADLYPDVTMKLMYLNKTEDGSEVIVFK